MQQFLRTQEKCIEKEISVDDLLWNKDASRLKNYFLLIPEVVTYQVTKALTVYIMINAVLECLQINKFF